MIELGSHSEEGPVSLAQIAESENLPLAYLERIVAHLKKADLVISKRGAHGGYVLARPSDEITMDEIVSAVEGAIAPMECFVEDGVTRVLCSHEGEHPQACATKVLWTRVQMGIVRALQSTTLAELVGISEGQPLRSASDEAVPAAV